MDVIIHIRELMQKSQANTDLTSDYLVDMYKDATTEEKRIMDHTCMCICGLKLEKIINKLNISPVKT